LVLRATIDISGPTLSPWAVPLPVREACSADIFTLTWVAAQLALGAVQVTDSKSQAWSPVPTSDLSGSTDWNWSNCARAAVFTGTPDPGLYKEQIVQDSGGMVLTVPVPSGSYIVNLYFAEPCSSYTAGNWVFGVALNGPTIVSRLDLAASAGVEKPVIDLFAYATGLLTITRFRLIFLLSFVRRP
jgi:hypothetical protein